jgi:hypothetical protein
MPQNQNGTIGRTMQRIQSQLFTILRLNRGPTAAVAAEVAPYLGAAYFGSQLRAILVGEVRRNLRKGIGEGPWQFGATEGPWFSQPGERLYDHGQSEQILDVGAELFQKWLTTDPDGSLASDELHKVVMTAIKRIEKLPVPTRTENTEPFGRATSHQATLPLLAVDESDGSSHIGSKFNLVAAPIETRPIANDEAFEPSSFDDMIALARQTSGQGTALDVQDNQKRTASVDPVNDSTMNHEPQLEDTTSQLMPMTGLPPFPYFDMSTLDEAV